MKVTVTFVIIAVLGLAGAVCAQDLSNYYRPYGFTLPILEQGEYVLSVDGGYNKQDYEYFTWEPDRYGQESEYKEYAFGLSALYAVSNTFLVQAGLEFYPSQTFRESTQWFPEFPSDTVVYESLAENLDGVLMPSLTLVFRPRKTLEFYVSGWLSDRSIDVTYGQTPDPWDNTGYDYDYRRVSFGVTYLGKL